MGSSGCVGFGNFEDEIFIRWGDCDSPSRART